MSSVDINSSSIQLGSHTLDIYSIDRVGNTSNAIRMNIIKPKVFNVKDYGAKGDGTTDDTQAVRNTIESANSYLQSNNGVTVIIYFPTGIYLIKQFKIYSNMLLIGDGINRTKLIRFVDRSQGSLYNSGTFTPYTNPPPESVGDGSWFKSFITNYDFRGNRSDPINHYTNYNIGIMKMTINGNGYSFNLDNDENKGNMLVKFKNSKNITIDNVRLEDSMNWHLDLRGSKYISIGYIEIEGNTQRDNGRINDRNNQDGINMHGVHDATIDRAIVYESYDDSLFIGAGIVGPSNDPALWVPQPAFNITVNYLEVYRQVGTGHALVLASEYLEGCDVYNVHIKYVKLHNLGQRGMIVLQYPNYEETPVGEGKGIIHDIQIDKIESYGYSIGNVWGNPESLLKITTRPQSLYDNKYNNRKFYNIYIKDIYADFQQPQYDGSSTTTNKQSGIVLENVRNVIIDNVTLINKNNQRHAISFVMSSDITINNAYIRNNQSGGWPLMNMKDTQNVIINNTTIPYISGTIKQGGAALRVEGNSRDITIYYRELRTNSEISFINVPNYYQNTIRLVQIR
jgi:polygalacturonase